MSWKSTLQSMVTLSTTETKFIACIKAMKEILWLTRFIRQLKMVTSDVVNIVFL